MIYQNIHQHKKIILNKKIQNFMQFQTTDIVIYSY